MRSSEGIAGRCASDGATLLEVMVALVLLGMLIVPVALGVDSAVNRSTSVRAQANDLAAGFGSSGSGQAWKWGPALTGAVWRPGPALDLTVKVPSEERLVVGLWCDGWPLGEREVDPEGRLSVQASDLRGLVDGELVVRVREAEGTWCPVWRSLVPDSTGAFTLVDPAPDTGDADLAPELPPQLVIHAPAVANPSFELSSGCGETEAAYPGLTFRVPECTGGRSWADLEGRVQSWLMEQGRALDVYF